jgi:UDP-glucose 4-epimerase
VIAVTGGTGFIGRRFVEAATAASYDVRLLLRTTTAAKGRDVFAFDLAASKPVDPAILLGVDMVVHLAARVPSDHADPAEAQQCMATNAFGTLRLIEAMQAAGVQRLVQATSANAYAPWVSHPDELAPLFPEKRVYYLGSKIAQELLARYACLGADVHLTTLRLGSVYGAGQDLGAIPGMMRSLLARRPVTLVDGGSFGADFVYVDDVVDSILLCLKLGVSGPFNVGSGTRSTMKDIVDVLLRLTGEDHRKITFRASGDGPDFGFPSLNISKLVDLGWEPIALETGLEKMLRWMRGVAPSG